MDWGWWNCFWSRRGQSVRCQPRSRTGRLPALVPAMVEFLELRQMLSDAPVNVTESIVDPGVVQLDSATGAWQASRFDGSQFVQETLATWQAPVVEVVVVHGDLWGNGQQELIRFDSSTGSFHAEWQVGNAVTNGIIATWVPGMDLQFLTVRDLNHDGFDDLIAYDRNTGNWAASTSQAGGGYDTRFIGTWTAGTNWQTVTFADINADGYDDVLGYDPDSRTWHYLFGATGAFSSRTDASILSPGDNFTAIVASFDGIDGTDLLQRDPVTSEWYATSFVDGSFQTIKVGHWDQHANWVDLDTIDFWGTGREGIIGRNVQTNEWQLLWSVGSGFASSGVSVWAPGNYVDAQVADTDHDGREELIARQVATGHWYRMWSTPSFIPTELLAAWRPGASYDLVRQGDFNSDSHADWIGLETGTGQWNALLSSGTTGYTTATYTSSTANYQARNASVGDFDVDGRLDVMSQDAGTNNWQMVTVNNGQLTANRFQPWTAYGANWLDPVTADFTGDGDADLLARDAQTGDWWLTSINVTTPTTTRIANWSGVPQWEQLQSIDYDGNGSADVIARDPASGNWSVLRTVNGVVTSSVAANWSTAVNWIDFQVVDIFGNGRPMIVARNATTNEWQGLWSSGSGFATGSLCGLAVGRTYVDTQVVGFFGDGRQTVVTRDAASGTWYALWYAAGRFQLAALSTWNSALGPWSGVTTADLDGSGRAAIYGFNAVLGEWRRLSFDGVAANDVAVIKDPALRAFDQVVVGRFLSPTRDTLLMHDANADHWLQISYGTTGYEYLDVGQWLETTGWTNLTVADFNRDDRDDLFGYSSNAGWRARTFDGTRWNGVIAGVLGATGAVVDVAGASDNTLRASVLGDLPELSAALAAGETRTAARLIRMWVASAVDSVIYGDPLLISAPGPAESFYDSYVPNRAGSSCGGVAEFYIQVLKLFQIDSLSLGFGDNQADLTHSTVVVPVWENGQWSFEIFDPTFNCSFVNINSGVPVTFLDLVDSVRRNDTSDIAVEQASNDNREFLSTVPNASPQVTLDFISNGIYVYRWNDYSVDDYVETNQAVFAAFGYAPGIQGFYQLLPQLKSVHANRGAADPAVVLSQQAVFMYELAARGIFLPA